MSNNPLEIFNATSGTFDISLQPPRNKILRFDLEDVITENNTRFLKW